MPLVFLIVPAVVFGAFAVLFFQMHAKITSDAFANWYAGLTPLVRLVLIKPIQLSISLARHLTHGFGINWKPLESLAVSWMSGVYQWAALAVTQAMEWPLYMVRLQFWLLDVAIPRAIRAAIHGIRGTVHVVTKTLPAIERTIVKLPKLTKAQAKALVAAAVATYVHPFLSDLLWLRRHFHALTAVLPRVLPIPHVPTFPNIWKRLRALEKKLAVPVAIGVVAAALARLGAGWIRCSKVKRVGKKACGFDDSWIGSFLADALLVTSALSIVEMARDLQTLTPAVADGLGYFVREAPAGFHAITNAERAAADSIAGVADAIINRL